MEEIKEVGIESVSDFNRLAGHPLQSFEWGEFRKKTGVKVLRAGSFESGKLTETLQMTLHPLIFGFKIAYVPKCGKPSEKMLDYLFNYAMRNRIIFIKFEPLLPKENNAEYFSKKYTVKDSPHPLFTKYSFILDIQPSEDTLLKNMSSKTRYNIKVAKKHNVRIYEDNSPGAFEEYLKLTGETVKRQGFFAHSRKYHELMWETLGAKTARLLKAEYISGGKKHTLVTWILFIFNGVLYYPYGASSSEFRNVMASNLMMWEAILYGKKHGCRSFDMWGALSADPDPEDPWYGFHRFKEGYGGKLVEFIGSFDLIINPFIYCLYNYAFIFRNIFLKLKSAVRNLSGLKGI